MTRFHLYVAVVIAAGAAALGVALAVSGLEGFTGPRPMAFWVFAGLLVVSELKPIRWLRRQGGGDVTASWTFAIALLLLATPASALVMLAAASLLGDVVHRKPVVRGLFNAAQLTLALAAGWLVLDAFSLRGALVGDAAVPWVWLPVITAAGAAVYLINAVLTCVVLALHQRLPVWRTVRAGTTLNLSTDGMLVALAPAFVLVAQRSLLVLPLLVHAAWAVYRSECLALARRHEATHDLLTDLPNRRFFFDQAREAREEAARHGGGLAVALLDLDGFKEINDRLGHHTGDLVLKEVARRLNRARRSTDLVARLGGDEFAVLLRDVATSEEALAAATRLHQALEAPCLVESIPVAVGGSFGVALFPEHSRDVDTLVQLADVAMYGAKAGGGSVSVYHEGGDSQDWSRLDLVSELQRAIDQRELVLHYQPKISVAEGTVVGVEALVRWDHPRHGLVSPGRFMPLAEHTELMGPLTEYVLGDALTQAAAWQAEGLTVPVAVNGSARNLHDPRFPATVARLLAESGVQPANLELEITENTVMTDPGRTASVLAELRAAGVAVSVDDFGTGYSSMANLRRLPIDRIKIDRSFVRDMLRQEDDGLIVRSIIELARNLGLGTVAEGVEDGEVLDALLQLGCDTAQGYHIARPAPAQEITAWLRAATLAQPPAPVPHHLLDGCLAAS